MPVVSNNRKPPGIGRQPLSDPISLRRPVSTDGARIWRLVAACPPLDRNSMYCNLLQCRDFARTSVLAEMDGEAVGWVSGYRRPDDPSTLFVWQVAVHERARGLGLARRMLLELLGREELRGVVRLQTTITPGNDASHGLFRSIAERQNAAVTESACFDEDRHFEGRHASERLITIGPLKLPRHARDAA